MTYLFAGLSILITIQGAFWYVGYVARRENDLERRRMDEEFTAQLAAKENPNERMLSE